MAFDRMKILAGFDLVNEEVEFHSISDDNPVDDIPSVDIQLIDDKESDAPKMWVEIGCMYHDGINGKMAYLKNNPEMQDKLAKALQKTMQAAFRVTVHKVLGEPNGLDEKKEIEYSPERKAKMEALSAEMKKIKQEQIKEDKEKVAKILKEAKEKNFRTALESLSKQVALLKENKK